MEDTIKNGKLSDPEKQKFLEQFKQKFQKGVEEHIEKNGLIPVSEKDENNLANMPKEENIKHYTQRDIDEKISTDNSFPVKGGKKVYLDKHVLYSDEEKRKIAGAEDDDIRENFKKSRQQVEAVLPQTQLEEKVAKGKKPRKSKKTAGGSPETDELKKREQEEKGYKVVDKRKLSASEREGLEEKLVAQEAVIELSTKKKDEKEKTNRQSPEASKIDRIMEGDYRSLEAVKIDEIMNNDSEKTSGKSRAEMPKVKDGAPEETESIIEKLEKDVEAKRNRYAMSDYKATNVVSRIKKILPFMKTNSGDVLEVQGLHTDYVISQNMLLDEKIKALKAKGLSGDELKKEMGNLVNYFKVEEKRKLLEAHTNSRAKTIEEKFGEKPGKIAEFSSRFINGYRKMPTWKKTVLGLGLSSIGLGAISRVIGAGTGGVGTKIFAESIYRKIESKKDERGTKKILRKIESEEDKYNKLYEYIEDDIKSSATKLKREKIVSILTTMAGVGVGYAIGSGATAELIKWGAGHAGKGLGYIGNYLGINEYLGIVADNLKEIKRDIVETKMQGILPEEPSGTKLGGIQPETLQTEPSQTIKNPFSPENSGDSSIPKPSAAPLAESAQPEKPSIGADSSLKSGDIPKASLPENTPGDNYASQQEGSRSFAPPSEELRGEGEPTELSKPSVTETQPSEAGTENVVPDPQNSAVAPEAPPAGEAIPEASKTLEIKSGSSLSETLADSGLDKKEISSMLSNYVEENGLDKESLDDMYPGQEIILNPDGKSIGKILESHDSHLMKSIKEIAQGKISEWREMKDLLPGQLEKPSLIKGLAKVMERYHETLGDIANPKSGEKIQNWVARMAKMAMEKQK